MGIGPSIVKRTGMSFALNVRSVRERKLMRQSCHQHIVRLGKFHDEARIIIMHADDRAFRARGDEVAVIADCVDAQYHVIEVPEARRRLGLPSTIGVLERHRPNLAHERAKHKSRAKLLSEAQG